MLLNSGCALCRSESILNGKVLEPVVWHTRCLQKLFTTLLKTCFDDQVQQNLKLGELLLDFLELLQDKFFVSPSPARPIAREVGFRISTFPFVPWLQRPTNCKPFEPRNAYTLLR